MQVKRNLCMFSSTTCLVPSSLPPFLSPSFLFTFRSLIQVDFTLICGVTCGHYFIFIQVVNQRPTTIYKKRLSLPHRYETLALSESSESASAYSRLYTALYWSVYSCDSTALR